MKYCKRCRNCKKNRHRKYFEYKPNGKLCPFCKDCFKIVKHTLKNQQSKHKSKKWVKKNNKFLTLKKEYKIRLIEIFGGGCKICGYRASVRGLHFHHLNQDTKCFNISSPPDKSMPFEEILIEAQKCILLCANCHAEIHS